jgi:hypothetical protein
MTMAAGRLFRYLVEASGPKPFMQVVIVDAGSDPDARAAVMRYLTAAGATFVGFDEEETALIEENAIPDEVPRMENEFGVVAVSGRIYYDPNI